LFYYHSPWQEIAKVDTSHVATASTLGLVTAHQSLVPWLTVLLKQLRRMEYPGEESGHLSSCYRIIGAVVAVTTTAGDALSR